MKLHINTAGEIASAWKTGKSLAALCGYTRVLKKDDHDKRTAKAHKDCSQCSRIAIAYEATGQAGKILGRRTAKEIEAIAKPRPAFYVIESTTLTPWN